MALLTTDWTVDGLILISLSMSVIYFYMTRNYGYWKKLGVKELSPTFFFGNVAPCIMAKQTPEQFIREVHQKNKSERMVGFYVFDQPYLLLRDPELIKDVFIKDFHNFSNKILTGNKRDPLGSKSVFLVRNPPWKYLRQKLSPIFTSGKLKRMFELMIEICQDFDNHLDSLQIDEKVGKPIEIKELYAKFMTDLIGTTAFGMKLNSLTDPNAEFRKRGREMFRSSYKRYLELMSILFIPSLRFLTNPKFFDESGTKFLRESFWDVIHHRKTTGTKRSDLIDLLIEMKKKQDEDPSDNYKLEGDDLVAQAAIFFSGGFETSSTTSSFALYEIAKNQKVQTRLRDEILTGLKKTDGKLTYELVTNLPYFDMVIQEALRMYPVLSWLDRTPDNDYTFSGTGITVKKDTPIILPMRALHMDPNFFPDPETFDPERFSEANKKSIVPCSYFPFGEGPRNCIGGRLGMIQTRLALIKVISKYEVTHCKETISPMKFDNLNVVLNAPGGIYLNFRRIPENEVMVR
ncbi:hypothetical protein QAD02_019491 [Eretmocerus hayati]|uniref:Uncharacterized protein n=1 Tax=Eretmocerus hayati TaxID=131215 RepID=A0ACC2PK77_9HYME|nr:hypothetical protein QAD02_019491 [Eretmocerus hayati]